MPAALSKLKERFLKSQALLVALGLGVEQEQMVVRTLHRVHPKVVAHLQMLADFLAGEAHHVELVLIFIEVEHVANVDRSRLDGGIELQRSVEGNVSLGDLSSCRLRMKSLKAQLPKNDSRLWMVFLKVPICLPTYWLISAI